MSTLPPPVSAVHGGIPTHLTWSIIVTILSTFLCCTWIGILGIGTGIAAIVFATQVGKKLNAGDLAGAAQASRVAKILCWITTGIVIVSFIYFCYSLSIIGLEGFQALFEEAMRQAQQSQ